MVTWKSPADVWRMEAESCRKEGILNMKSYKKRSLYMAAWLAAVLITGCGSHTGLQQETTIAVKATTPSQANAEDTEGLDIEFTASDLEVGYEETTAVKIVFDGDHVTSDGDGVTITDTTVTVTQAGDYLVTGETENGRIIVNAGDSEKVHLILDGVSIKCPNNAPVYIKSADKVFLTLKDGTENILTDETAYSLSDEDQAVDAVIYSKADFTINGTGALTVTSNYKHGIVSKDDLVITGGTITVTALGGGLYGKDCVKIKDGKFVLNTGGDGIQSDNGEDAQKGYVYIADGSFDITSAKDGIQAETVLLIDDGNFAILSGGGEAEASVKQQQNPGPGSEGNRGSGNRKNGGKADSYMSQLPEGVTVGAGSAPDGAPQPGSVPDSDPQPGLAPDGAPQPGSVPDRTASSSVASDNSLTAEAVESMKGLKAGTKLLLNDGFFEMDAADDAIHSNGMVSIDGGTFTLSSGDDAVHGGGAVLLNDGEITITSSYEGIEGLSVTINGGSVVVKSSDDGINAAEEEQSGSSVGRAEGKEINEKCYIRITGGTITIDASADGIDSNGSFYMDGGVLYISGSENGGDSALDYDGEGTITGGTIIGAGSANMGQGFTDTSSQAAVIHNFSSILEAGTAVRLTDKDGTVLAEYTPVKPYQSVVLSAPALTLGSSYILEAGNQKEEITVSTVNTSNGQQTGEGKRGGKGVRENGASTGQGTS